MLSVGTIRFEDRFCASKKGGIGGGGQVSARGAVHMAAALATKNTWLKFPVLADSRNGDTDHTRYQ